MKKALRILGFVGLCLATAAYAFWVYLHERHDLPPFDRAKAAALSSEKRAEYERHLFNELPYWNTGTPRYRGNDGTNRREADWLAAANDGYELAYITLQVLQPSTGFRYSLDKPLKRLTELAEGGDAGAMCLWFPLVSAGLMDDEKFGREYRSTGVEYLKRGAALHHPACLNDIAYRHLRGFDGIAVDKRRGFVEAVESERNGYGGSVTLNVYFVNYAKPSASSLRRSYCWGFIAGAYSTYVSASWEQDRIRGSALKSVDKEKLLSIVNEWFPAMDECVALGLGEEDVS